MKHDIVFYAEHEGYYSYFHGVIEELTLKHNVPICYVTSSKTDPILQTQNKLITPMHRDKLLPFFMLFLNTKVFVMTLTDLQNFHLKRSIHPVNYVYMFHALVSTHMMYREGAFDHYDTIFCCGPHHTNEIRKREEQEGLKEKKLVSCGYYRLEQIYNESQRNEFQRNEFQRNEFQRREEPNKESKTILIAPSWGDHNIVKTCGIELIEHILNKTNHYCILRPHPEIRKSMPERLREYEERFGENRRFTLETSVATNESMLKADLLITDLSGIALEYAFGTERPVLFIDLPYKIKNENHKKLGIEPLELAIRNEIGTVLSPDKIGEASSHIEELINKKSEYQEKIVQLRNQHVYAFGNASQVAAKSILDLI